MPKIHLSYIFRIFRNYILRLKSIIGKIRFRFFQANKHLFISDHEFVKSLDYQFNDIQKFLIHKKLDKCPLFFVNNSHREKIVSTLDYVSNSAKNNIISEAENICSHVFDLLGSSHVNLGKKIDWHLDFKTNHQFNRYRLFFDVKPAKFPGGFDIKVPWELNRFQHLPRLGQAYWLTLDEKYASEFVDEVTDWIINNPYPRGVNWSCTMEVAIRVVNWLWGYAFFSKSKSLDDSFILLLHKSLLVHAKHIKNNLEWHFRLTTNHYLANLVALVYCGLLLPEFKEAKNWSRFGFDELENEIKKQVFTDGMDYEGSTSYHRLVTELLLSVTVLAEIHNHKFSQDFNNRLEKMIQNISTLSHQDGSVALIGDQDNGRLLRLKAWQPIDREWNDFRPIIAIGSIWKWNTQWASEAIDCLDEAVWFFGPKVKVMYDLVKAQPVNRNYQSIGLANSGFYILRNPDFHITINARNHMQYQNNGHAHNDQLSFELFLKNQSWIIDPGTNVYTDNYMSRNEFRSSKKHNFITIDGIEDDCWSEQNLFLNENRNTTYIPIFHTDEKSSFLVGKLGSNTSKKIVRCRGYYLDNQDNYLLISDIVNEIPGTRRVKLLLSPDVKVYKESFLNLSGLMMESKNKTRVLLINLTNPTIKITLGMDNISPSYGKTLLSCSALFEWSPYYDNTIVIIPESFFSCTPQTLEMLAQKNRFVKEKIKTL